MKKSKLKLIPSTIGFCLAYSNAYAGEINHILDGAILFLSMILFAIVTIIFLLIIFRKDRQFVKFTLYNLMTFLAILFFFAVVPHKINIELPSIIIKLTLFSYLVAQFVAIKKTIDRRIKRDKATEKNVSNEAE